MAKEVKRVCQNCRFHKNKPSRCLYHLKTRGLVYVGRKGTCERFKNK